MQYGDRGRLLPRMRMRIGVGVHIYIYVCGQKKYLNRTLTIDSPYQNIRSMTSRRFIDWLYHCALQKRSPH